MLKIGVSLFLIIGFVLLSQNLDIFMPRPEPQEVCGWGICLPDVIGNLKRQADWTWNSMLITGILATITLISVTLIWTRGVPNLKGGRFGGLKR